MTERSAVHHTFTIERTYGRPVDVVFAAWSDPEAKRRWFATEDGEHELDFRVGGTEVTRGGATNGAGMRFETRYHDIVPGERIVYSSTLSNESTLATISMTTVEFRAEGDGTVQVLTESGVFLDGHEQPAWREQGTGDWLTKLGAALSA
jgi:uncharacterized protein YndB with AHSA1/START domain